MQKDCSRAVSALENPVIFIEHKFLYNTKGDVPEGDYAIPIGKAEIKRDGRDITIVSYSRTLLFALEAAETLSQKGIEAEVIDLRTIEPLDMDTILESVKGTGRLLVVHEFIAIVGWAQRSLHECMSKHRRADHACPSVGSEACPDPGGRVARKCGLAPT